MAEVFSASRLPLSAKRYYQTIRIAGHGDGQGHKIGTA
jgi:hypothetical protein